MNQQLKEHTIKVLEFLKDHKDIDNLTLTQIQERMIQYESLLIEFVEKALGDEEDQNGTLTSWWLFDNVEKKIYHTDNSGGYYIVMEDPKDFVDYLLKEKNERK